MDDIEDSLEVLIKWLNTFKIPKQVSTIHDLRDGSVLLTVLNFVASDYFLCPETGAVLTSKEEIERFNDIKTGINKFCTHGLANHKDLTENLNSEELVRGGTVESWVTLLELVLLASIKSSRKNECIHGMMQELCQEDQELIMEIITRALEKFGLASTDISSTTSSDGSPIRSTDLYNDTSSAERRWSCGDRKETMPVKWYIQRIDELEDQVAGLQTKLKVTSEKCHVLSESTRGESLERNRKENLLLDIQALKRKNSEEISDRDLQIQKLQARVLFSQEDVEELEQHAQEMRQKNEGLLRKLKSVERNAASKLTTIEEDLQVANSYRRQVKILETKESQIMAKVEALQNEVHSLSSYKALYQEQLNRIAELEEELKVIPSLKEQVKEYKKSMIRYKVQGLGAGSSSNDCKVSALQQELVVIQSEKSSLQRKLEDAQQDIQQLEVIVKEMQKTTTSNCKNLEESLLTEKLERYKKRIAALEAEISRTVSKARHNETLDALDTHKRLVEQLSLKLSSQSEILNRERRREEQEDRQVIEELEKKNEHLKDLLANVQKTNLETLTQLKANEKEKAVVISTKEQDYKLHIKELQEKLKNEKQVHNREQRLMMSALYSSPFNINHNG